MAKTSTLTRVRIISDKEGGWNVVPGGGRPIEHAVTQREAQNAGRDWLQNHGGGELTTHGTDNKFRQSDTIAHKDPFPPRG